MNNTKTLKVYIVGYESCPIDGGVSGFDWMPSKDNADKHYEKILKDFEGTKETFYRGTLNVEVDSSYSGTEEERVKITERIDYFLYENDWENSFKEESERKLSL
jgi:hypothetical protein